MAEPLDLPILQQKRANAAKAGDDAAVDRYDARIAAWQRENQQGPPASAAQEPPVNPAWDVLRSVGTGLRSAVEGTIATPQDLISLAGKGAGWATGTEQDWDLPYLPSSQDVNVATSSVIGPSYQPQTTAGKFARSAAEFAPVLFNPLAGVRKVGMDVATGLGAGLASEAAGQATAGTALEPWARAGAGMGAGVGIDAARVGREGLVTAPSRQAEAAAEDAALQHGVRLTRGERTGNINQQMEEQQMLHGARGNYAQQALEQRRQESLQAIKDAGQQIADIAAPTRGTDPVQSGGLLNEQMRTRAENLMTKGGQDIEAAINAGVMIDADALRGLPPELQTKLAGTTPFVPDVVLDVNTPVASTAMSRVEKFVKQAEDPNIKEFSLAGAEQLRRQLGKLEAATPEDRRALGKIREYFDDWYDDTIANKARITGGQFTLPGTKSPEDILNDLKAARTTFREGADIARPRGAPAGGKEVSKIAAEGALPEETARLFKPNDRGDMSTNAMKTIERLKKVGATSEDLDQVRGIVLDTLLTGDPGKVATRVDNFIRNNQTAAASLFTPEQLDRLNSWKETNRKLVPDPKATNPSRSSYGIIGEMGKEGIRGATGNASLIGSILGGPLGTLGGAIVGGSLGAGKAYLAGAKAKKALEPADRRSSSQFVLHGTGRSARKAAPGAIQAGQMMTIDDPGGDRHGERGKVVSSTDTAVTLRMPDGKTKTIGNRLVKPAAEAP